MSTSLRRRHRDRVVRRGIGLTIESDCEFRHITLIPFPVPKLSQSHTLCLLHSLRYRGRPRALCGPAHVDPLLRPGDLVSAPPKPCTHPCPSPLSVVAMKTSTPELHGAKKHLAMEYTIYSSKSNNVARNLPTGSVAFDDEETAGKCQRSVCWIHVYQQAHEPRDRKGSDQGKEQGKGARLGSNQQISAKRHRAAMED